MVDVAAGDFERYVDDVGVVHCVGERKVVDDGIWHEMSADVYRLLPWTKDYSKLGLQTVITRDEAQNAFTALATARPWSKCSVARDAWSPPPRYCTSSMSMVML